MANKLKSKRYGSGDSFKKIYLIAPEHPENFWSMQGTVELFGAKTLMPNAALATLMALTPEECNIEYILCDENVSKINFNFKCDLVAVTGSTLHCKRIIEICNTFRSRGVKVALGGTYATINEDLCKNLADYLFIGEGEYTWPEFLKEWTTGNARSVYIQHEYIDMKDSPAPDWDLIDSDDYLNINIQTSRGCPNQCEFCDVIQYVGRKYRIKTSDQILEEIKTAHSKGARSIFFSDDNFLGNKNFTLELLPKIIEWNSRQTRPVSFSTQITLQVADDESLLKMFADAKFSVLFLGVETVRKESLKEVKKEHNLKHDLNQRIKRISRYGIVPFIGLIVGFDNDDISIFDDLYEFIDETYNPIVGISLLNAPKNTPLYKRLKADNRIIGDDFSGEWQLATNVIPKQMTIEILTDNYWKLFKKIYDPDFFNQRCDRWLRNINYFTKIYTNKKSDPRQLFNIFKIIKFLIFNADSEMRSVFIKNIKNTYRINPLLMKRIFTLLAQYRHFYDFVMKYN
ncbi:MAG: DUF4070 domain-containing protein [Spirochaetes bacterium]|nr:DUF4070 domain-containing protein [Spirochaetota bacterium]